MSESCSKSRHTLLVLFVILATPFGAISAQAIARRDVTSTLISAAEDSSTREAPALLDRLGITRDQVQQIRVTAAQYRLQRQPIFEQMRTTDDANNSSVDQGNDGILIQRLRDLNRGQDAAIAAILTPVQLRSLKQLAPAGTIVISRTPAAMIQP